jgi:ABC-type transport system involved in cytochrome c biogenesis permease subunit
MWGGKPYPGVSAQYHQNPLGNIYEVIFFFNGQTLTPGTILWQNESTEFHVSVEVFSSQLSQALMAVAAFSIVSIAFRIYKLKKTRNIVGAADRSNL